MATNLAAQEDTGSQAGDNIEDGFINKGFAPFWCLLVQISQYAYRIAVPAEFPKTNSVANIASDVSGSVRAPLSP